MPGDGSKTKPPVLQAWTLEKHQDYAQKVSSRSKWWPRPLITAVAAITAGLIVPELVQNRAFQAAAVAGVSIIAWDHRFITSYYLSMFSGGAHELDALPQQSRLVRHLSLLFCGLFMALLANIIVSPIPSFPSVHSTVPVLLGGLMFLAILPSLHSAAMKIEAFIDSRPKSTHALFILCIFNAFFLTQISIATSIYSFPTWDPAYVLSNAFGLANGSLETLDEGYFAKYPNNITLTLLLAAFNHIMFALGMANLLLASILLNIVVLLSGVLFTYLAARRLAGTGAAVFSLLPSGLFIVLSPWMTVPYSDTFGLFFPALSIYLYIRAKDAARSSSRIGLWAAIGLTGALGYSIKPTVVIVLVAIVVVTFAPFVESRRGPHLVWPAIGLSLVLTSSFAVAAGVLIHTETNSRAISFDLKRNADAVPITHFLKMGAQGNGGYNEQDVAETLDISDPTERFTSGFASYRERVEAMGPIGYADFLRRKAVWTFGDGTFFVWAEGLIATDEDPFLSKDHASRQIQSYFWLKGDNFPVVAGVWQSFWFVTLLLVALPVFLCRRRNIFGDPAAVMRISLFGLTLFLMLFETRSRYLFLYLPFFILLMVITVNSVMPQMRKPVASAEQGTDCSKAQELPCTPKV